MNAEEVKQLLLASFTDAIINVKGDDGNFSVEVISQVFDGVNKLNRQKNVLLCVKQQITSGEIHAFSVQAYTQAEWEQNAYVLTVL